MTYAIIEHWDEEPYTAIYATDASLLRIQRYCKLFDLTLQAYGDMQVFSEPFDLSKSCIRLTVRNKVESTRQTRYEWREKCRRRDSMTPEELGAELEESRARALAKLETLTDPHKYIMARCQFELFWGDIPTDTKFDGIATQIGSET